METLVSLFSTLKSILEELGSYFNDSNLLIYVSLAVMAITLLTHVIFKKVRLIKYIPGFIVVIIGVYNFYGIMNNITATSSLPNLLLFIIGVVSGLIGILFALIIGIFAKPVKRAKKRIKKDNTSELENKNKEETPFHQ